MQTQMQKNFEAGKRHIVHMFSLSSCRHYYYDATNGPTFLCLSSLKATPVTLEEAQAVIAKLDGQPGQSWDIYDLDPDYLTPDEAEVVAYSRHPYFS